MPIEYYLVQSKKYPHGIFSLLRRSNNKVVETIFDEGIELIGKLNIPLSEAGVGVDSNQVLLTASSELFYNISMVSESDANVLIEKYGRPSASQQSL